MKADVIFNSDFNSVNIEKNKKPLKPFLTFVTPTESLC